MFSDLTRKIGNILCKMAIYCVNFGVNFILQKFCLCKKNDKYEVWTYVWHSYTLRPYLCSKQVTLGFYQIGQTKWEVPAPLYVFYGTIRFCGKNWNSVDKKEKMKTWPDMTCSHVLNIWSTNSVYFSMLQTDIGSQRRLIEVGVK